MTNSSNILLINWIHTALLDENVTLKALNHAPRQ